MHLLGESLNESQELHKAHWGCLQWDLRRPGGGTITFSQGRERGKRSPPLCPCAQDWGRSSPYCWSSTPSPVLRHNTCLEGLGCWQE